ncbi:hypothetical protein J2S43_002656 [Catenuloplanes nepalensis]|uniref:Uncharacterized protein n=1 Tax=Catenuloplanes nepalensis TaxID=587533 RepID=A0ABT9MRT2_9ACTN|nr:hypothetical protein [Catenuloplanes nepalensis]MDP9794144.1 hypothetical protein [Catenuloplanes nepalensis]
MENVEMMLQQAAQAAQAAQAGTSAIRTLIGALTLTAIRVPQFVPLFLLVVPLSALLVTMIRRRSSARNEQFRGPWRPGVLPPTPAQPHRPARVRPLDKRLLVTR